MTDETEENDGWSLHEDDREILVRLGEAVAALAPLAKAGPHMIALGEVWDALEAIVGGRAVEVNVGLSVGFRRAGDVEDGEERIEEGFFMCLRINEEELVLDELNTCYSSDVGSDSFTRVYATLAPGRRLDAWAVEEWLGKLAEVKAFDDARLTVERDHV